MKKQVQVSDRLIGDGEPTFVIAEVGSNHNQKLQQAKELIEVAAEVGADAVKFQLFLADIQYPDGGEWHEAFKAVELDREWVPELAKYSEECGLIFFSSVFDTKAVDCMEAVNVPAYKVASSETTNLPLLKYIASKNKPILVSTGMCDLADVYEGIECIKSEGNFDITLFQCSALYPTDPRHSHLRAMDTLQTVFGFPTGLSDHTLGIVVPIAAVARGACQIEKTLTLSRDLCGPDHAYALEPTEFKAMVEGIRVVEESLGSSVKRMLPEEAEFVPRFCIRASKDIDKGIELTRDDLVFDRPASTGIRPRFIQAVIGRTTVKPLAKGEEITWDKI